MKMKAKSLLVLVLSLALVVTMGLALSACGGDDTTATTNDAPAQTTETPTSSAPGMVDMAYADMKSSWEAFTDSVASYSEIDYDKVKAHFGVDGVEDPLDETSGNKAYTWYASDTGGITVLFDGDTGSFLSAHKNEDLTP
ncbi:MAG: hypothetical protein FWE46_06095 [Coriobacteriia bacterium]|nr:hypothetical protein [Coriobacteriia bacterium]MCL2537486.1 hypothetical protein [Coriobacteriia bacterium]